MQQVVFSICLFSCFIYQAADALVSMENLEETCLQKRVVWRNPEFSCAKRPHDGTHSTLKARSSKIFDIFDSKWWMILFHDRKDRVFINVTKISNEDERRDAYLSLHLKKSSGTETTLIQSRELHAHDRRVTADTSMTCSEFESREPGLAPALPKNMTVTLHLWTEEWNKEKCAACFKTSAEVTSDGDDSNAELESTSTLQKNLEDLLLTGDYHDVVFKVQNREFKAHKSILRARFPVFAEMFRRAGKEWSNGSISIVDCEPETFGDLLRYAYTGKLDQTPARVMSLYYVADKYEIPSLKRMCAEALKSLLSITIVSDVISFATKHNESGLLRSAETFFSKHMEEIMVTEEWQRFLASYPSQANTLCLKTVKTYYKKID